MEQKTENNEKFLVLPMLILALCQIGTTLDLNILSMATGSLIQGLSASMEQIQLANLIYPMVATCLMLFTGIFGIKVGWTKTLKLGAFFAFVGELVAGLSPSITMFIWIGRILTGIGGSIILPSAFGCIVALYRGKNRVQAFGFLSAASGFAMIIPIFAGYCIDKFGWRTIYIAMAVYFLIVFIGTFKVPTIKADDSVRLDYPGTVLYIVAIFILSMCITKISTWGLIKASPLAPFSVAGLSPSLVGIVVSIVLFAILFKMEKKTEQKNGSALIPQSFIKNKQVLAGLLLCMMPIGIGSAIGFVVIPYLQLVIGFNALKTSFLSVFSGLLIFVGSSLMPKLFAGKSMKKIAVSGTFIGAIGLLMFTLAFKAHSYSLVFLLLAYTGYAIMLATNNTYAGPIVTGALNARDAQQSGGLQPTARNLGSTLAIAIIGMVMLTSINSVYFTAVDKADITPETRVAIEEEENRMSFMSDQAFKAKYEQVENEEDMANLLEINAQSRKKAVDYSLYVAIALVILAGLYEIKHIPNKQ